ncbi:MAG TPA: ABC transporter ATP-binding protein [Bacteroidales bacterium]|nr:ABC transporter ATP-binding protein [Bacteroidales bacterium]
MTENVIELTDLTKRYGSFTAVDHLNLIIRKGEIFGLLGPNGAGKTTTILMLLGLTDPTSGNVRVCGIDSTSNPIEVKRRVGYLPENVGFYDDLTGLQNLVFTGSLNNLSGMEALERAEELLEKVGMSENADKKTIKYSRGMLQRLGLADVLIKNPEVIILDEPTLGIDPSGVREFMDLIVTLSREHGITVLFCSHHLHQVQQVCDRVGIFVQGSLIAQGNIETLSANLFAGSPYIIELGITNPLPRPHRQSNAEWLNELLGNIEGIISVNLKNNRFMVECTRDVASEIARTVVESGAGLNFLNRKEYGLDDIYYRYFEGGENHE